MQIILWCKQNALALIMAFIALLVIIVIILVLVHKHKCSAKSNIYKTNEGFLGNYPTNRKPRRVAVVAQRTKDGAVAIVKIFKLKGREKKFTDNSAAYVPKLILDPAEHTSLDKASIVGRQVIIGIKDGTTFKPIHIRDLEPTKDRLKRRELKAILKSVQDTPQHKKTYKKKMRKWRRRFKK